MKGRGRDGPLPMRTQAAPRRSERALLTHSATTLGCDVEGGRPAMGG